jgi:putative MATE family efflux protein
MTSSEVADEKQQIFAELPVPRAMAKLVIPTVLSQLVTLLYNLADAFFVGHTNDPNQLAALTLSFPLFMLLTAIGNVTGIGANSMISRALGAGDPERARKASVFGVYGGLAMTLVLSIVMGVFMRPILTMVGASADTYGFTASYLRWTVVLGGVPTVFALLLAHLTRGEGNTKQASIGMALGSILNIVLDPIFVSVLGLGVSGAGIATALSNCAALVYFLLLLYRSRGKTVLSLDPRHFPRDRALMAEVVLVGLPAALVVLLGASANVVLTHCMAPYGDRNVAAFGVVQKLGTVTIQITIGLTQGVMPLIGYNYAAGNRQRTHEITRDAVVALGVYVAACLLLMELLPAQMIRIFTTDAETVAIGTGFLRCWILCAPGMCFVQLFNAFFQAMGKWQQSMFLSIFRQALLLIPLLLILNQFFGLYGLIWSQPISDTASLILGAGMYLALCRVRSEA